METMQSLIRRRLCETEKLVTLLTTYDAEPAIFYQTAPDDTEPAWNTEQYPRIVFLTDLHALAERNAAGQLEVDILCTEAGVPPEKLAHLVRDTLSGVFFAPQRGNIFSLTWRNFQTFHLEKTAQTPLVVGITVVFDIIEFPNLETSDPDPVAAINRYACEFDKHVTVIGTAPIHRFFVPTRTHPAAYFRKLSSSINRQTNTVVWLDVVLVAHFFAPTLKDRCEWIEQFAQRLALDGEVTMLDGSPMLLQSIKGNAANDELQGQLQLTVQYGLLRRPIYAHPMSGIRIGGR